MPLRVCEQLYCASYRHGPDVGGKSQQRHAAQSFRVIQEDTPAALPALLWKNVQIGALYPCADSFDIGSGVPAMLIVLASIPATESLVAIIMYTLVNCVKL